MLSERLKTLISALGLKKGDFSKKIGFSQAYISMILKGKRMAPSDRFFDSIHRQFQVNMNWLRNGEGEMFENPPDNVSTTDSILLEKYKSLPPEEKKVVDEIIDAMLIKSMTSKENYQEKPPFDVNKK